MHQPHTQQAASHELLLTPPSAITAHMLSMHLYFCTHTAPHFTLHTSHSASVGYFSPPPGFAWQRGCPSLSLSLCCENCCVYFIYVHAVECQAGGWVPLCVELPCQGRSGVSCTQGPGRTALAATGARSCELLWLLRRQLLLLHVQGNAANPAPSLTELLVLGFCVRYLHAKCPRCCCSRANGQVPQCRSQRWAQCRSSPCMMSIDIDMQIKQVHAAHTYVPVVAGGGTHVNNTTKSVAHDGSIFMQRDAPARIR
jgi:hypothetical protein